MRAGCVVLCLIAGLEGCGVPETEDASKATEGQGIIERSALVTPHQASSLSKVQNGSAQASLSATEPNSAQRELPPNEDTSLVSYKCRYSIRPNGNVIYSCINLDLNYGWYYGYIDVNFPVTVYNLTVAVYQCTIFNTLCSLKSATHGLETDVKIAAQGWAYKTCISADVPDGGPPIVFMCSDLVGYPVH